jgi:hypothetical protein
MIDSAGSGGRGCEVKTSLIAAFAELSMVWSADDSGMHREGRENMRVRGLGKCDQIGCSIQRAEGRER